MPKPQTLQIEQQHLAIVPSLLQQYLPSHKVYAFGSRAQHTAQRFSDLDLLICDTVALDTIKRIALQNAFSESDLPWKVDLVMQSELSSEFYELIQPDLALIHPQA